MAQQYNKERLTELFEKLPAELQEAVFSMDTAETIRKSCETYGIEDERVGQIAELAGLVLMGLALPEEFSEKLENEIKLPKVLAQVIGREINRFVFYPLKPALEELNKIGVEPSQSPGTPKPEAVARPAEEYQTISRKDDTYRESIE
ncbi:MAG: hypothetical protein Q7S70_02520 [bacterium]|nr:hypothetical protein [bacterium]